MPSSVIAHYHYHKAKQQLSITFVSGLVYHYQQVPENIYNMLKAAGSKGRYFNHYIKDKFKFKKVED